MKRLIFNLLLLLLCINLIPLHFNTNDISSASNSAVPTFSTSNDTHINNVSMTSINNDDSNTEARKFSPNIVSNVNNVFITTNVSNNQIIKSNYSILISINSAVDHLSLKLSTATSWTNITGPLSSYIYRVPNFNTQTDLSLELTVNTFNSLDQSLGMQSFYFIVNDNWVIVKSINPQGKLLPNSKLDIVFDPAPLGINWRWDLNNVVSNGYSSSPIITTPSVDGSYRLDLLITNSNGTEQPVLNFFYMIDGTAPPLVLLTDISQPLPSGQQILFQNTTDQGLDKNYFNFTFKDSNVYTSSFPKVPFLSGSYILIASVHDELGNICNNTFLIKAKIGILSISPTHAGRPGIPLNITLSENPFYQNFTFFYPNGTIYSSSYSVPNLPTITGTFTLKLYLMDHLANWNNVTYSINVDNTAPVFISITPGNNSIIYSSSVIGLVFDEVPYNLIYNFDNGANMTGAIYIPSSAGSYVLHVFASDQALNWITLKFSFVRLYKPVFNIANNSIVRNNFVLIPLVNDPVTQAYIHWDNNLNNQTFTDYTNTSGLHTLNYTLVYNNYVSKNIYFFIINVTVLSFSVPFRLQSNQPIGVNFSENNVKFSWKWNNDPTWKFTSLVSYYTEGVNTLYINMMSSDAKYNFIQSFSFTIDNSPPVIRYFTPFTAASTFTTLHSGTDLSISFTDKSCSSYCYSNFKYYFDQDTPIVIDLSNNATVIQTIPLGPIPTNRSNSGFVNVTVIITDTANNIQKLTYSYIIDDYAPKILDSNFQNNSIVSIPWYLVLNLSEDSIINVKFNLTNTNKLITETYFGTWVQIPNIIFGNNSISADFNISDSLGNFKDYNYYFTTVDPALNIYSNASLSNLRPSQYIYFFTNKPLLNQSIRFSTNDNPTTFKTLNCTVPTLTNYEGIVNMTVIAFDYQGSKFTKDYFFYLDTKAPTFIIKATRIVNNGNSSAVVESTFNKSTDGIVNPSTIIFNITDAHSVNSSIRIECTDSSANGSRYIRDYLFENKSFLINLPGNESEFIVTITLTDSFGNSQQYSISLKTYQDNTIDSSKVATNSFPTLAVFSFVSIVGVAGIAIIYIYRDKALSILKKK